jgi:hypothetical protein
MFALPMRDAFMVPAAIHKFNVLVERVVSLEAAWVPMYPERERSSSIVVPAQAVDATLACSLLAGVWKPKV